MIAEDEWLVVIDRQRVFAESEWSTWACPDGSYHNTDEAFARLAAAFGDRVAYTCYIAPQPPHNAWIDYFKGWPQFLVAPDDPMYDRHRRHRGVGERPCRGQLRHVRQMG